METETSKTPNQIQSRIQTELIENGFESGTIDGENLYQEGFNIYKFCIRPTGIKTVRCRFQMPASLTMRGGNVLSRKVSNTRYA